MKRPDYWRSHHHGGLDQPVAGPKGTMLCAWMVMGRPPACSLRAVGVYNDIVMYGPFQTDSTYGKSSILAVKELIAQELCELGALQ